MNDIKVLKFRNGDLVIGKTVECEDNTGFTPASSDEEETSFEQFTATVLRRRNLLN